MSEEELKQMSGDELIGIIKAQRFEIKEIDLLIKELRDTIENQKEEIDRLNNIINELEKWCNNGIKNDIHIAYEQELDYEDVLDKLKALKNDYNNKYYDIEVNSKEKDILSEHLASKSFYNDEVEIPEEENKIPEKLTKFEAPFLKGDKPDIRFGLIIDQINELIDYLKSKGE